MLPKLSNPHTPQREAAWWEERPRASPSQPAGNPNKRGKLEARLQAFFSGTQKCILSTIRSPHSNVMATGHKRIHTRLLKHKWKTLVEIPTSKNKGLLPTFLTLWKFSPMFLRSSKKEKLIFFNSQKEFLRGVLVLCKPESQKKQRCITKSLPRPLYKSFTLK